MEASKHLKDKQYYFDKFDRYATINFRRIKIVDNLKINQRRREIATI